MISPNRPEPSPKPGQIDVWPAVIDFMQKATADGAHDQLLVMFGTDALQAFVNDCAERNQIGIAKYGTPLQTGNGRDCDRDLYQELLDGIAYAYQGILESLAARDYDRMCRRTDIFRNLVASAVGLRAELK